MEHSVAGPLRLRDHVLGWGMGGNSSGRVRSSAVLGGGIGKWSRGRFSGWVQGTSREAWGRDLKDSSECPELEEGHE